MVAVERLGLTTAAVVVKNHSRIYHTAHTRISRLKAQVKRVSRIPEVEHSLVYRGEKAALQHAAKN